jgi:glutathione S-transferase
MQRGHRHDADSAAPARAPTVKLRRIGVPAATNPWRYCPVLKLLIGNKNYSSWSMRPWVLMKQAEIPFEEVMVRFDEMGPGSPFKRRVRELSPAGRVPVLVDDDGLAVWDTLAIAETLAERFPEKALWPRDRAARARARSITAEMHSGFTALRTHLSMNVDASMHAVGERVLAAQADVRADIERISALWEDALRASGGPFLFGDFCIADAFYAPVASRFRTYGVTPPGEAGAYAGRLLATAGVSAWVRDALEERDFLQFEEPYRTGPTA